jgi:MoxR-like ATPase
MLAKTSSSSAPRAPARAPSPRPSPTKPTPTTPAAAPPCSPPPPPTGPPTTPSAAGPSAPTAASSSAKASSPAPLRERRWILLDEVNRADIDKCFGELFTVLSGGTVTTAYTRLDGETERPVEIGPDTEPYAFGPHIRLVATMNVRDKASLFRLSYAFMRRFAAVHVPALDDAALLQLAERDGERLGLPKPAWTLAARALSGKEGFGAIVELGPALLRDVLTYVAQRPTAALERAVAEAIELLVFPQLEGAEDHHALPTDNLIDTLFTDPDVRRELHASLATYVPALQGRWPR